MIISEHRQNMTVVQTVKVTKHLFPESINPELSPVHKNHLSLNPIISPLEYPLTEIFQGIPGLGFLRFTLTEMNNKTHLFRYINGGLWLEGVDK